jgi:hypothetical protein
VLTKLFTALSCIFCLGVSLAPAQTGSRPLSLDLTSTNSFLTNAPPKPAVKEISPGIFEVGLVRLDKEAKKVSFPAVVNMREGIAEYWLVNTGGKVHESVLRTEAKPANIHVAMLLLGAHGRPNLTAKERIEDKNTAGDTVAVWVEWTDTKGEKHRHRAEEWVRDLSTKSPMSKGDWIYNGSWIFNGTFVAQRELSIVANIHDHDALINNPRPKREDDDNWTIQTKAVPPKDTPVTVIIELIKPYVKPEPHETKS